MAENLPDAGYYVDNNLKDLFVTNINQLIADLGRPVVLYMQPTASGCPNCGIGPRGTSNGIYNSSNPFTLGAEYNKPFATGGICPVCKGTHDILTEVTVTYTATIGRAPKDINYDEVGINPTNVYKTKMVLSAFEDLKRCKKALIDGEYCVRLRDPIQTGLKDLKYVRCWWKKLV